MGEVWVFVSSRNFVAAGDEGQGQTAEITVTQMAIIALRPKDGSNVDIYGVSL